MRWLASHLYVTVSFVSSIFITVAEPKEQWKDSGAPLGVPSAALNADESCQDESTHCSVGLVQLRALEHTEPGAKKVPRKVRFFPDVQVSCTGHLSRYGVPLAEEEYKGCDYPAECQLRAKGTCEPDNTLRQKMCDEFNIPLKGYSDYMIVLTQEYNGAYYHFVSESLNRLWYVHMEHPKLYFDKEVLIHTSFITEPAQAWARMLGIDTTLENSRLVLGKWNVAHVIYPPTNNCFDPDYDMTLGMRSLLEDHPPWTFDDPQEKEAKPTALLLQRIKRRVVENHAEVLDALQKVGWNVEVLSDENLPDVPTQCSMFHHADLIVGPHGAGFSNLVCARTGTQVIEFTQSPPPSIDCFENLAVKFGCPFTKIPSTLSHRGNGTVDAREVKAKAELALQNYYLAF